MNDRDTVSYDGIEPTGLNLAQRFDNIGPRSGSRPGVGPMADAERREIRRGGGPAVATQAAEGGREA